MISSGNDPTSPPTGKDLLGMVRELEKAFASSPVNPLDLALRRLGRSLAVFVGNAAELRAALSYGQQVPQCLEIGDADHPERLERFLDELDRLLHNYLAASFTLSTHTINLRDDYFTDELRTEYSHRMPFDSPVGVFVKQLRHVTQHGVLPVIQQRTTVTGDHFDSTFILHTESLNQHKSWSGGAKQYLADLPDNPRLDTIVDEYTGAVETFTVWVFRAVTVANAQVFGELQA